MEGKHAKGANVNEDNHHHHLDSAAIGFYGFQSETFFKFHSLGDPSFTFRRSLAIKTTEMEQQLCVCEVNCGCDASGMFWN